MADMLYLIPLMPLVAFLLNILLGRRVIRTSAHWVAIIAVFISWVTSLLVLKEIWDNQEPLRQRLLSWIPAGSFDITASLYADQLTAVMLLVVSTVGLLVCIYSVGYMHGEGGYYRFFAYIPLFIFSMFMLVLADNLLVLFVFWEAVGLCSYLLIGFYFRRRSAANAAKKAFIVNRVGDLGFGLGIMLTFWTFGNIYFYGDNGIFAQAADYANRGISQGTLTAIGILLLIGACGKSAQFPLHVWLPDAMEGPTPVSALIHAATMVTAGVYMMARNYDIYTQSATAMTIVAVIGTITALMGSTIALTQFDIKKVIAYSTVSQLGFMVFAIGVGAWPAAIFHLMTHAFFKGLLFLGSGSVIHGMHGEQDMRKMGGLRKHMPLTFWTFLIASAANAGVVPLAGFWSKDEIIAGTWGSDLWIGKIVTVLGLLAAFFTALYMFRVVFLTFFGEERYDEGVHPHESGAWMAIPLVILAIFSVIAGFAGFPPENGEFHHFVEHSFPNFHPHEVPLTTTWIFGIVSTIVALSGITMAYLIYQRKSISESALIEKYNGLYRFLFNKWYIDEAFDTAIVRPMKAFSTGLWKVVDDGVIDGAVNGIASGIGAASSRLRRVQTGLVANYALAIALGTVVLLGAVLAAFSNLFQ